MSLVIELERSARQNAEEALKYDSDGSYDKAISSYKRAIESLIRLSQIFPSTKLNKTYMDRCAAYQNRIKKIMMREKTFDSESDNGSQYYQETSHKENTKTKPQVDDSTARQRQHNPGQQKENNMFENMIVKEKPNIHWDSVVGLDQAKTALRQSIIYPTIRPDLFPLGWPRGVLLYGPPGCGKTILAASIATEINSYFINVDASSIMSKWLGDAEKNVAMLFKKSRELCTKENKPVILFIDEVDSLLGQGKGEVSGETRLKNQFMSEMDGLTGKGKDMMLYVIGATNKPWSLEWPFLRRFSKRIYVPLPDLDARTLLFELYTSPLRVDQEIDSAKLAAITEGYSASDIKDICQSTQLMVVDELFNSTKPVGPQETHACQKVHRRLPRKITLADFNTMIKNRKPSVNRQMTTAYSDWSSQFAAL